MSEEPNDGPEGGPQRPAHGPRGGLDRRLRLVQIAYLQIAMKGFEGLRTHDVALEAGINNATLHYYYPTKEALIKGVVEYLLQEFAVTRVPREPGAHATPLEQLEMEFEDIRYRFLQSPEMAIVLTEFSTRALRDPAIAGLLGRLYTAWRNHLETILQAGINEGMFRQDLNTPATASAIMAQIVGIGTLTLGDAGPSRMDELVSEIVMQVKAWVMPAAPR